MTCRASEHFLSLTLDYECQCESIQPFSFGAMRNLLALTSIYEIRLVQKYTTY